jgi:hypothetical protein
MCARRVDYVLAKVPVYLFDQNRIPEVGDKFLRGIIKQEMARGLPQYLQGLGLCRRKLGRCNPYPIHFGPSFHQLSSASM